MAEESEEEGFGPGAGAFGKLKGEWDSFLEQPGARTALLQFGINMMQPPSFGDTGMSQFGRAVGAAGEATTRQQEIERKEYETEAKADLAASRGLLAESRVGREADRSRSEAEKLGFAREREQRLREAHESNQKIRLGLGYQNYVNKTLAKNAAIDKEWDNPMNEMIRQAVKKGAVKPPPTPILSYEDWLPTIGQQGSVPGAGVPAGGRSAFSTPSGGGSVASPTLQGRPSTGVIDVATEADYNALPSGQKYRAPGDPPGKWREKP